MMNNNIKDQKHKLLFTTPKNASTVVGTGLFALDVVVNIEGGDSPRVWAGGSCGNVLTILSYLGWESYPVVRLGNDSAAKQIKDDLSAFDVKLGFVQCDESILTPIIIEKIGKNSKGVPKHSFFWICPNCGTWLPRYKAPLLSETNKIVEKIPKMNCFYFDRASASALLIAEKARNSGALVVYEPPSIKDSKIERKAIGLSHIVKFAHERNRSFEQHDVLTKTPSLLVETQGSEGLRYMLCSNRIKHREWKTLPAYEVYGLRDAAGAGDWCTAGIIHLIGQKGSIDFDKLSENSIIEALRFGQALGALNCRFEGARGIMYSITKQAFKKNIMDIMKSQKTTNPVPETVSGHTKEFLKCVCPGCTKNISIHRE